MYQSPRKERRATVRIDNLKLWFSQGEGQTEEKVELAKC